MTRSTLTHLSSRLLAFGYEQARLDEVRAGREENIPALNLLEAGVSVGHVYTLFTISRRLVRYNTARCNGETTAQMDEAAERDEREATTFLAAMAGSSVPRTTVIDAEITGLPGGASFRVRLKSARTGEELRGNDFGDGRYTAF